MKLGIDFGTTHTIVSVTDQGNYPTVSFCTTEGDWMDYYPSLIAVREDQFLYGFEAQNVFDDPEWVVIRSIKSLLKHVSQKRTVRIREKEYDIVEMLTHFLVRLKSNLLNQSNLDLEKNEPLQVTIAVPAHSNNTQRFITTECFSQAGFEVINMINEPSAATMEYTHSFYKRRSNINKKYLLVYDLGGGTFDASIAEIQDKYHKIIATEGIDTLGGDQFDDVLAKMVKEELPSDTTLKCEDEMRLLDICKEKKEQLTPYSKIILLEWSYDGNPPEIYRIRVSDYYQRCEPLIEQTVDLMKQLISRVFDGDNYEDFMAFYLVGGMSNFPKINRRLKEQFGSSRVRKSKHCESATAIGLAVTTDMDHELVLKESLTRYFGLWREGDDGKSLVFDPIFHKDQSLPAKGEPPIVYHRQYSPTHNVGVFRFQECSALDQGKPAGLITVWNTIKFPFEPKLQNRNLNDFDVERYHMPVNYLVKEIYFLDHKGELSVQLINCQNGYSKNFPLSRMEGKI